MIESLIFGFVTGLVLYKNRNLFVWLIFCLADIIVPTVVGMFLTPLYIRLNVPVIPVGWSAYFLISTILTVVGIAVGLSLRFVSERLGITEEF